MDKIKGILVCLGVAIFGLSLKILAGQIPGTTRAPEQWLYNDARAPASLSSFGAHGFQLVNTSGRMLVGFQLGCVVPGKAAFQVVYQMSRNRIPGKADAAIKKPNGSALRWGGFSVEEATCGRYKSGHIAILGLEFSDGTRWVTPLKGGHGEVISDVIVK